VNRTPTPKDAELDGFGIAAGMPVPQTAWQRKRAEFSGQIRDLRAALDETAAAFDAEHGAGRAAVEQAALNRLMDGTAAARAGRMIAEARWKMPRSGEEG
jgi:hypothetical protein